MQLTAKSTECEQAISAHLTCAAQLEAVTTRVKDLEASQGSNSSQIEERMQQSHASHAQEMSVLLEKWQLDKVDWSTQSQQFQVLNKNVVLNINPSRFFIVRKYAYILAGQYCYM